MFGFTPRSGCSSRRGPRPPVRRPRFPRRAAGLALAATVGAGSASPAALITADAVADYQPGDARTDFQQAAAAKGPLQGDTGFGGLNPFNPPFDPTQVVLVGAGGTLKLHLSAPVSTAGRTLGVFVNNGYVDVSSDGSGRAGNPASTFSAFPQALVGVSRFGTVYVPLNGGQPVTFDKPTNYYLDSKISDYFQPLGTQAADQGKPFLAPASAFDGETYDQMLSTLDGSAGGAWLDLSGTGLSEVNFVSFDVPAGASYRMAVDSVSAVPVPEPASAAALALVAGWVVRRRR